MTLEYMYHVVLEGDRDTHPCTICTCETEERANELVAVLEDIDARYKVLRDSLYADYYQWVKDNVGPRASIEEARNMRTEFEKVTSGLNSFDFGVFSEFLDTTFIPGNTYTVDKVRIVR